jgi:hypothetical protein
MPAPDDKNAKPSASDDLLSKLRASAAKDVAGDARRALKGANQVAKNISDIAEGTKNAVATAGWLKTNIGEPLWAIANPLIGRACRAYGRMWNKRAYVTDADGDRVFSKKRAGIIILASAFAAAAAYEAVPETARSIAFATWWATTNKTEYLVMNKADPSKGSSFVATGCHSWPCDSDNTIDFQIDDSAFHDIHRLITHREMFYPSFIAAAVPAVPSACEIDYYGSRGKVLARWGHFYPRLFDVKTCLPIPPGFPEGPITKESFDKLRTTAVGYAPNSTGHAASGDRTSILGSFFNKATEELKRINPPKAVPAPAPAP